MAERQDSRDRVSIDLKGVREKIQNFRDDPAWQALSINKQVRILIEIALGNKTKKKELPPNKERES